MSSGIKDSDMRVVGKMAKRAAEEIAKHYGDPDIVDDESIRSLESAMRYRDDGYEICKQLDDDGWEVDAELVALMNNACWWRIDAKKEIEAEEEAGNVTP